MESSASIRPHNSTSVEPWKPSSNFEINKEDQISHLPKELLLLIFGYLGIQGLGRCGRVSRKWAHLSVDPTLWNLQLLKRSLPLTTVYDIPDWKCFDLSAQGISTEGKSLSGKMTIKSLCQQVSRLSLFVENKANVSVMPVLKGSSVHNLQALSHKTKEGRIGSVEATYSKDFGDIKVDETYWIVITNHICTGTRNSTRPNKSNPGQMRVPKTVEMAALLTLSFVTTQKRLYHNTMTHCEENNGYGNSSACAGHRIIKVNSEYTEDRGYWVGWVREGGTEKNTGSAGVVDVTPV